MKTIVLSVNGRVAHGDPAKEILVGVYQVTDEAVFREAVEKISAKLNQGKWLLPKERADSLVSGLTREGFMPITSSEVFAAIF